MSRSAIANHTGADILSVIGKLAKARQPAIVARIELQAATYRRICRRSGT
jgi:hypothetical protein